MKRILLGCVAVILIAVSAAAWWRYETRFGNDQTEINLAMTEYVQSDYPADPAPLSTRYKHYSNRDLKVVRHSPDSTLFDFILTAENPDIADITFKNIDLAYYVPRVPNWVKGNKDLELISLVEREWNRQQTRFTPDSEHITITGGDGFEKNHIATLELARNCLNAGLWEIILTTREDGAKKMYYQGWFDFPMAHYADVFKQVNGISYAKHWYRLDHWKDPEGTNVELSKLRNVVQESPLNITFHKDEPIIVAGEQKRKIRTVSMKNIRTWNDFYTQSDQVQFATFRKPGVYDHNVPWKNKYWKMATFKGGTIRETRAPADGQKLYEVELQYEDAKTKKENRIIISGIENFYDLPQLPSTRYNKGLYMPMGISVPPFYQAYDDLKANPPYEKPYFSVMLNDKGEWINHHNVSVDGPVMYRDAMDPHLVHLHLLSYERHSLIAHYTFRLDDVPPQMTASLQQDYMAH